MPRDMTFAPEKGSRLPTAKIFSRMRKTATCSPPTSAHTPVSGTISSRRQTRTAMASRGFNFFALVGTRRTDLTALSYEDHVAIGLITVHEVAEALQDLRRLDRLLPFALVALDVLLHRGLELGGNAQAVLAYHLPQIID